MCGINGFNFSDRKLINEMNRSIKYRGPDDEGVHVDKSISIGQVRLSIIDLSPAGHNPMFYSKKNGACSERHKSDNIKKSSVAIVFNGEIYNYLELKQELAKKSYCFTTSSDTEVILASYLEWGFECVKKFNGMWAFCIYDQTKNILFLSRDRLGVKPLYYYNDGERFVFSSELKGILSHKYLKINQEANINKIALELYFSLGFIPAPSTIYNNVYKLEASHNIIFDITKKKIIRNWQHYDIPKYSKKKTGNKKELIEEGRAILRDAVRLRMIADVPVGAFLSGGLDSSTVVGEMKALANNDNNNDDNSNNNLGKSRIHTFSIGFEGKYDETRYMNIVKEQFKTEHHHEYMKEKDFHNLLAKHAFIYDEPFADASSFPTYYVSKLAKKYVTVCLSGDGGDEMFGGYNIHLLAARMNFLMKLPRTLRFIGSCIPAKKSVDNFQSAYFLKEAFRISLDKPEKFFSNALSDDSIKTASYKKWTEEKLGESLAKAGGDFGEAMRLFDLAHNSLADNFLTKVDRASMANALEIRSPFLDYRFIEFSMRIPTALKTDLMKTKKIMREMIKGIVPGEIIKRKKQGFTPPIEKWISDKRYDSKLKNGLAILKKLHKELYEIYANKIINSENRLSRNYKIRLLLFAEWWDEWIN